MLQLRVIRAFKSNLEDLEDRRSIHSLRSLRSSQQTPALSSFFHQNRGFFRGNQQISSPLASPSGNISIAVPVSLQSKPLNINNADINARYMDDDGPPSFDERNGQSKETRI